MSDQWTIQGYDTFEGGPDAYYPLNNEKYATEASAYEAARKFIPASGVGFTDLKPRIYVVSPTGKRKQVF
ncbi:hypothetical protein IT409_00900 [Candidatus Falkowbacteria bacterium]|nr:hypothetical protein [Candidatus Falkowbacteria bacterium]